MAVALRMGLAVIMVIVVVHARSYAAGASQCS